MDQLLTSLPSGWAALLVIPVLGVLVFVHELGHFWAARLMKVKVEEFGFGYPPRIATLFERNGVKYTLNALPLGGFVRMTGEEGNFDAEGSLATKRPAQRAFVLIAGPLMNLLFSILVFSLIYMLGVPRPITEGPVMITAVAPNSPAAATGLQPGDVILSVAGTQVRTPETVSKALASGAGTPVPLQVQRGDQQLAVKVIPRRPAEIPPGEGAIGIAISLKFDKADMVQYGPIEAVGMGVRQAIATLVAMVGGLVALFHGFLIPGTPAPAGGVSGPVGIARLTGELAHQGLIPLLSLTGFLGINLFLINLLPLPALDGGRLVFVILEALRRGKRINPEREALVHLAGMLALITLIMIISYLDVTNWLQGRPIPGM